MAAKFTVDGTDTKISFEYEALTATIISVLGDASHYLWEHGFGDKGTEETPIAFDDLTNQQKLDLVDVYVKKVVIDMANSYKSNAAQLAARETEAEAEYEL